MPSPISRVAGLPLSAEARRPRTTPKPVDTFQSVLRTGAQVLLAGASAASGLVGGPLLSTAIDAARASLAQTSGQGTASGGAGAMLASGQVKGGTTATDAAAGGGGTSEVEAMRQLQKEGAQQNLQYLQLQQEAQDQNRRFSTASNLLKSRHDTARSAINNLRV